MAVLLSAVEADAAGELLAVVEAAVGDYADDVAQGADVLERVAGDQDQVRTLAYLDGAGVGVEVHDAGGDDGRGLDGLHRSHAGLDVELQLAVEAVAEQAGVAAGDEGYSCGVQGVDDLEVGLH